MKIKLLNLVTIMLLSLSTIAQQKEQIEIYNEPLLVYLFASLSVLLLVIIFLLLRKNASSDHHNQQKVSSTTVRSNNNELEKLKRDKEELVVKLSDYQRKLEVSELHVEESNQKNEYLEQEIVILKADLVMAVTTPVTELEQNKINPTDVQGAVAKCEEADGHFYLRQAERRDRKTLYRIFEKEGRHFFTIDKNNEEAIKNALSFYDIYLDGYCESSNAFPADAKSIEVLPGSDGKLLREGDRFKVIEKIKVKFI